MYRRILFVIFVFIAVVFIAYFFLREGETITNYPPKNQKVVAFGDSLIEGVGSTEGNDFVSVISRRLGVGIINKGKSGDTTGAALLRVDDVLVEEPGVVIVLLGGNDALRRIPKKETFENLGTIIERFQSAGAVVVLLGVRGGILSDGYESDYHSLSKKYRTAYVSNILDGLIGNPQYMYDGIHPNDQGYIIVADRVAEVLQKVMQKI